MNQAAEVGDTQFLFSLRQEPHFRVIMLTARHPDRTQFLDPNGKWVTVVPGTVSRPADMGLVLRPTDIRDPAHLGRLFRAWLINIRQDTPAGKAIWNLVREIQKAGL